MNDDKFSIEKQKNSGQQDNLLDLEQLEQEYRQLKFKNARLRRKLGCYALENEQLKNEKIQLYTDGLTDCPNHDCFTRKFVQSIEKLDVQENQVAIVSIDINDLKEYNDMFGHSVGSALIAACAHAIQEIINSVNSKEIIESDSFKSLINKNFLARVGGDEFAAVIWNSEDLDPDSLLDQINDKMLDAKEKAVVNFKEWIDTIVENEDKQRDGLKESLRKFIDSKSDIPIFSVGTTIHKPGDNIYDTLKKSNKIMYEEKKDIKSYDSKSSTMAYFQDSMDS